MAKEQHQSRSKSRKGLPVSGVSLALRMASWNFFSSRPALLRSASTDCWKSDSRRLSWARMASAAASKFSKVFGLTGAMCEITPWVSGSTLMEAPQHGQPTSKGCMDGFDFAIGFDNTPSESEMRPSGNVRYNQMN